MFRGPHLDGGIMVPVLILLSIWVLFWKGYALWTAAKRGDKRWFIAICIFNTFAILDLYYIFYVAKKTKKDMRAILKVKI